jgi:hypothetical protein
MKKHTKHEEAARAAAIERHSDLMAPINAALDILDEQPGWLHYTSTEALRFRLCEIKALLMFTAPRY